MKRVLILMMILCLCLAGCGGDQGPSDDGVVDDIVIDGKTVTVTDFLAERLKEYVNSEAFRERQNNFEETWGQEAMPFTVTRVIELEAGNLGPQAISVHFLFVKADCNWAIDSNMSFDNVLLVIDYETGNVYDEFTIDPAWFDMDGTKEMHLAHMMQGPLAGSGYDGGPIIHDSEIRAELSAEQIAALNEAIYQ